MASKGRGYEHHLGNLTSKKTSGELVPLAAGYNGGNSRDVDLLIDDGEKVHVFELKSSSQDAYTLHWDENEVQKDDLYGTVKFCVEYPRPAIPYAGMRFSNRQLAITKLYINGYPDGEKVIDDAVQLSPIEAKHTASNNLRFYKPESGTWPAQNLDEKDVQHLLDTIGYQL